VSTAEESTSAPRTDRALRAFGALRKRLPASWHLLRDCTISHEGELYLVQLVIIHRDFGIGLIAFRNDAYTDPELAIRLTRQVLSARGFERRFPGHLPVVFVAAPRQGRELPQIITNAFAAERAIGITNPDWSETALSALAPGAEETYRASPTEASDQDEAAEHVTRAQAHRRRFGARTLGLGFAGFAGCLTLLGYLVIVPMLSGAMPAPVVASSEARLLDEAAAAHYLGLDVADFRVRREGLEEHGFPKPQPLLGGYDRRAIDRWIDSMGQHRSISDAKSEKIQLIR